MPQPKILCVKDFSWDEMNYREAKGYFFAGYQSKNTGEFRSRGKPPVSIIQDLKLNKAVWNKKGVNFSREEIDQLFYPEKYDSLLKEMGAELEDVGEAQFCHDPHHGIVFRNDVGCPFAHINICFTCNTVTAKPTSGFPGVDLAVARFLFRKKGIHPTTNYAEILAYSRAFNNNFQLDEPIYSSDSVSTVASYIRQDGESLTTFLKDKGYVKRGSQLDSVKVSFVVEHNGEVNKLQLPDVDEYILMWLWETKWKPATLNGEVVRSQVDKTLYF